MITENFGVLSISLYNGLVSGTLFQISEIKVAEIPDIDLSNVGVTKYGNFSVEVIDPVSDYLELMEVRLFSHASSVLLMIFGMLNIRYVHGILCRMCSTLISSEVFFQDQILGMFLHVEPNRLQVLYIFFGC